MATVKEIHIDSFVLSTGATGVEFQRLWRWHSVVWPYLDDVQAKLFGDAAASCRSSGRIRSLPL